MSDMAPHKCPAKKCGAPAYIPFGLPARCTNRDCVFYCPDIWVEHVMSLPDEGDPEEEAFDREYEGDWIGDPEDTQPQLTLGGIQRAQKLAGVPADGFPVYGDLQDAVDDYLKKAMAESEGDD